MRVSATRSLCSFFQSLETFRGLFPIIGKSVAAVVWGAAAASAQMIATEPFDYTETRWTNNIPGFYAGGTGWGTNTWQVDLTQAPGHPVPQAAIFGTNDYAPYEPQMSYAWGHGGRLYRDLGTALDSSPGSKVLFCLDLYTPETANSHVSGTLGGFGISIESQAGKPGELITFTPANDTWNVSKPVELTGLYGRWHRMTAEIEFFATGSVMRSWIDASQESDPHEVLASTCTAFTASRFYIAHWGDSGYALVDNIIIGTNFSDVALSLSVLGTNGALITSGEAPTAAKGTLFPALLQNYSRTNVFAITNSGSDPITLTDWATNGTGAGCFSIQHLPASLAPGAVSNFSVIYHPTNSGIHTASLSFSNNSALPSRLINLSGSSAQCFVSPSNGAYAGDYEVSIWHGYASVFTNVIVGAAAGVAPTEAAADHVTFMMPTALAAGSMDIVLQRAGEADVLLTNAFTYEAAWFIVSPSNGPYAGGNTVTVTHGLNSVITNVVVRGADVPTSGADTNSFSLVMPAVEYTGLANFTMQRAEAADFVLTNAYAYNPSGFIGYTDSDAWVDVPGLPEARFHHAAAAMSNRIYVIGGYDGSSTPRDTVYAFDGTNWTVDAALSGAMTEVGATSDGTNIWLAGGGVDALMRFDGVSWATAAHVTDARTWPLMVIFSNRPVVVSGGVGAVTEFDDGSLNELAAIPNGVDLYGGAGGVLGDFLIAAGGGFATAASTAGWRCDGSAWTAIADLPAARYYMATAVWRDQVYALGGLNSGDSTENTVYCFDGTNWSSAAALPYHICAAAAAELNDALYHIGGMSDEMGALTNVYKYVVGEEHTGVHPSSGDLAGGYWVTIRGSNLGNGSDVTNVTLCGVSVSNIVSQSATQIVVLAGASSVLTNGDVVVYSTAYGATVRSNAFTYIYLSAGSGPYAGGNTVTLVNVSAMGDGSDITNVLVGGIAATLDGQGADWVSFVLGSATNAGASDIVVQSVSLGETVFTGSYTYNPPGVIGWRDPDGAWAETVPLEYRVIRAPLVNYSNALYVIGGRQLFSSGTTYTNVCRFDGTNWEMAAGLPVACINLGAAVWEGAIYATGNNTTNVYRYDGSVWTEVAGLPAARRNPMVCVFSNRLHVLCGGSYSNVFVYDGTNWNQTTGLPDQHLREYVPGGVLGDYLYVSSCNTPGYTDAWRFDGTEWTAAPGMDVVRYWVGAAATMDRLYAVGGAKDSGYCSDTVYFDGTNWLAGAGLPYNQYLGGAAELNGALYAIGGARSNVLRMALGETHFGVSPSNGVLNGGYEVVIGGLNLGDGSDVTNVTLCGVSVQSIVSQSATQIIVVAGAADTAGLGVVRVFSTSFGETVKSNAFEYLKGNQTITFPDIGAQSVYAAVGLTATASSGLPVTFSTNGGPALITGGSNLTFTGIGEVSIIASQAGDANWNPAADVTNTFHVYEGSTNVGPQAGGNTITVTNGYFGTITNVLIGGVGFQPSASGSNWFTITMPAATNAGPVDFIVQTSDHGDTSLPNAYTYNPSGVICTPYAWTNLGSGVNDMLVYDLAHDGTDLYAGGWFTEAGGIEANYIAKWDTASGAWTNLGSGLSTRPEALVYDGTNLYAGGWFGEAGGVEASRVAKWDTVSRTWTNLGTGVNMPVYALAHDGTNLYAGGTFTEAGGVSASYVAMWDTASGTWTNLGSGLNQSVLALLHDGVNLYAGGTFTTAGGVSANRVAKWDAASGTWTNLGSGMNASVFALAHDGTNLYAGGFFTNAGGVSANYVAMWDTSSGMWTNLGNGMNDWVVSLAHDGTNLYVGGSFTNAGDAAANSVAMWNGTSWTNLGSGMDSMVYALAHDGTNLYAGGTFTEAGGVTANHVAKWGPDINEFGGVSPVSGSWTGGYEVIITGANLGDGSDVTNVTLCGVSAQSIVSQSATQIVIVADVSGSAMSGAVRVFSVSFGETVKSNAFTYTASGVTVRGTNDAVIVSGAESQAANGTKFPHIKTGSEQTNTFTIENLGQEPIAIDAIIRTIHSLPNAEPRHAKPDRSITVNGITYPTKSAYYASNQFKAEGRRCGTKSRAQVMALRKYADIGDCTVDSTTIRNEYWPAGTQIVRVVVHVIHKTDETGNLDDGRIARQIDVLNEDYEAIMGTLGELGYNTKIHFELAGITRTANDNWFYDNDELAYKTALAWDVKRYCNIYINMASGYLGYAYFPQEDPGIYDGLVINYEAFGGRDEGMFPYDQGRTVVHEMGHYFGLYHTFEGESACLNSYTAGDLIVDTPAEAIDHYGCSETTSCSQPDPIHNYMNYTDDLCMQEFTSEQANRMVCALTAYRFKLLTPETFHISPAAGWQSEGAAGGPFSPTGAVYAISNSASSAIQWSVTGSQPWLVVAAPSSGTLASGEVAQVTVSIASEYAPTSEGAYTAIMVFSNSTDGALHNRPVTLTVMKEVVFHLSGMPALLSSGAVSNFAVSFGATQPGDYAAELCISNAMNIFTMRLSGSVFATLPADSGPLAGGNTITVSNGNFGAITNILAGGVGVSPASSGANWFAITLPAATNAGPVDFVVQAEEGDTTLPNAYIYNPAGLIVTSTPASGSWTGGYEVVISGSNLGNGSDITNVTLCGITVAIQSQSATQIVVMAGVSDTPTSGAVRVFSTTFGETVKSNAFEYLREQQAALVFDPVTPQAYGATNTLSVSGGSGTGAVSYAVLSGPGELVGSTKLVVTNGSGDVVIRVVKAQDHLYLETSVTGTVTAVKAAASVHLSGLSQTYDGSARTVGYSTTPLGLAVNITYDGNAWAPTNAGSYSITGAVNDANWQGAATGTLEVSRGTQTIAFPTIGRQKSTNAVGLAATASSGLPVTFSVVSGPGQIMGGTNLTFTDSGEVVVRAAQAGNANWNSALAAQSVRVTKGGVPLDFDGDGVSDVALYWPEQGMWYILQSSVNIGRIQPWGWPDSQPVPADYDGDGLCDVSVYSASRGLWYIWLSDTQTNYVQSWGWSDAEAVPGDYDGDGLTDVAVYSASNGTWYIWQSGSATERIQSWGYADAEPVPGDYDGDGLCDVAVYSASNGTWYIWQSATQTGRIQPWGWNEAEPIPGDYDGDGLTDVAVYWPEIGQWYAWLSASQSMMSLHWGWNEAWPVPADYDGDGLFDRTVYAPLRGQWYIWQSATQTQRTQPWGWEEAEPVR